MTPLCQCEQVFQLQVLEHVAVSDKPGDLCGSANTLDPDLDTIKGYWKEDCFEQGNSVPEEKITRGPPAVWTYYVITCTHQLKTDRSRKTWNHSSNGLMGSLRCPCPLRFDRTLFAGRIRLYGFRYWSRLQFLINQGIPVVQRTILWYFVIALEVVDGAPWIQISISKRAIGRRLH